MSEPTTDLEQVLSSIEATCDGVTYGFATVSDLESVGLDLDRLTGVFQEQEGLTVFAPSEYLRSKQPDFEGDFAKITINVHTSLELVGLTAVLATELAKHNISANVVAAYYHDHIFVQYDAKDEAMTAIESLAESSTRNGR